MNMQTNLRQWQVEHGTEYAIPAEIDALVDANELHDQSWHNDISPSFGAHSDELDLRIWVEHPDPAKRESGGSRFSVLMYDDDGSAFEIEPFYTDDVNEAIERWRTIRKERGWA